MNEWDDARKVTAMLQKERLVSAIFAGGPT